MVKHKKIYLDYFYPGWGEDDFITCESCGRSALDIHHLEPRGMGGSANGSKDVPDNLMALCRKCHIHTETNPHTKEEFKNKHKTFTEWKELFRH